MPLETPTPTEERSVQVNQATDKLFETGDVDAHFARWEIEGVHNRPSQETQGVIDIHAEDDPNPEVWTEEPAAATTSRAEAPEISQAPLTRAQELEMTYNYLDDPNKVQVIRAISRALIMERNLV